MRYHRLSYLILILALWPALVFSEDQSLGEVTVHAEEEGAKGTSEGAYDSVSFSHVITSKELEGRRTNLSEVLQETAGVQIRNLGGLDDFATVSIRGSATEQVSVYLDDVLLNPGNGGSVNIATIPTEQIERIEVYKGAAPAWFGSSSIGGVVHIVTKKGGREGGQKTTLTQSFGSFTTYEGTLLHSDHHEPFSYSVGYTYSRSTGDFTFTNDNGTPFNPDDDRTEARRNNEFARNNLLTSLDWSRGDVSIGLKNQFFQEGRGIPGLATLTSETAHFSSLQTGTSFEATRRNLFDRFDLTLNPYFQFQKQQFSDPSGEIGLGAQDNDDKTFQYGSRIRGHLLVGTHQRWSLMTEYRGEQFLPEDSLSSSPSPKDVRNSFSAAVEDEMVFLEEKLVINPSVRTEHILNDQAGTSGSDSHPISGKMGIKYSPFHSGDSEAFQATFKTNLSRSYRIASFSELFGDRGTFIGNPDLRPEKSLNWDIGALMAVRPIRCEVSYFLNHVEDLIQLLQTSQFTIQAQNLSKGRIQGVETTLSASLFEHLDLVGNYTFQWAKDTSGLPGLEGKFLPGRPIHEVSGRATLSNVRGKLFGGATLIDDNFLDSQNILRADSRLLVNAGLSVSFLKRFTAGFEAKNLTDDRVLDVVGFPLPGRSFYGKLEVKI